jgi:hypothetical protein
VLVVAAAAAVVLARRRMWAMGGGMGGYWCSCFLFFFLVVVLAAAGGGVGIAMSACLVRSSDVGRLYYYNNKHNIGARKSGKRERGVLVRVG